MTTSNNDVDSPKARRVLAFNPAFIPGYKYGGPIKSMVEILDSLPESIKVTLVTADRDLGDAMPYPGLSGQLVDHKHHEVFYLNWRDLGHWMVIMRWARRNPFDLIYLNSFWHPQFTLFPVVAYHFGLLPSRKMLLAPRGSLSPGGLGRKSTKKRTFLRAWRPLLHRIDPVWHATGEMERGDIQRLFPRARVVTQIDSRGDDPREEIICSSERARFVFISRVAVEKNLILVLQALRAVKAEIDLDIYGPLEDARYWRQCQSVIAHLPRNVRVNYLGELQGAQVTDTFAKYDAFVFPTRGESFGHVIVESLSSGCPVICSQKTPWTHVLRHGGGAAIEELNPETLSAEIEVWANRTSTQRDAAKHEALTTFAKWRSGQGVTTAVERALDGLFDSRQTEANECSLRIALVTHGYESAGGVQTVARWLTTGLRHAGYEVEVFDLAISRADVHSRRLISPTSWHRPTLLVADSSDMRVTHVGANGVEIEPLRYFPRSELSIELNRFDLIQIVSGAPAPVLAAVRSRRPIVLQVATTVAQERASQLPATNTALARWRGAMTKVVSLMEKAALRRADVVLVENKQMQEYVSSVSQTRTVLAPPGVDTKRFTPRTQGWDSHGYLLSVCRLDDARKGLDRLIRSYALMRKQRPTVPGLVLVGLGKLPVPLTRLVSKLGLNDHVSVRENVPKEELPGVYRTASVYLQASFEEGLGISVIEAMASGLPVVSTQTAGTLETVVHGKTGWLVSQDSDLEEIMATRALSVLEFAGHSMAVAARSRAESYFSNQVTLSRFLEVYSQLIGPDQCRVNNE